MKRREVLAIGCATLAAVADPGQAVQPHFFGLNIGTELSFGRFNRTLLAKYRKAGVQWLRVWYNWSSIEGEPGVYRAEEIGRQLRFAKAEGFHLLFMIWGTPAHAGNGDVGAIPNGKSLAGYCHWLKTNFSGLVDAWEVGNEMNLSKYFAGTAQQYVNTLAVAYASLRGREPVIAAGPSGLADAKYWRALLDSGMEDHCDRVNLHPYRQHPDQVVQLVDEFRRLIHKPLWITEIGLSSDRGEATKAAFLAQLLPQLASRAERVFWYRGLQGEGLHPLRFGLLQGDRLHGTLVPLPAYYAYARCAGITLSS